MCTYIMIIMYIYIYIHVWEYIELYGNTWKS